MYRTSVGPNLPSPAEMIFGRKIPTNLPAHVKSTATEQHRESIHQRQQQTELWYNKNCKPLPNLNIDDAIYYQDVAKRTWIPGEVIGIGPEPRSYTVRCRVIGHELRRNRQLIRPRAATTIKTETSIGFDTNETPIANTKETTLNATISLLNDTLSSYATTPPTPEVLPAPPEPLNSPAPSSALLSPLRANFYCTRSDRHSRRPQRFIEEQS